LAAFHGSGTFVEGLFAVEQGAFYCSIVLAAVTVFIIEKQWTKAALWCFAASGLSLVGLLHSWRFSAADTVSALPLLERIVGTAAPGGGLFPAAAYALGYAGIGLVLLFARWFTEPNEADTPGAP
jgi:AGZA family xanthine/uracil permease-like MFS transporter